MKRIFFLIVLSLIYSAPARAAELYKFDKEHTTILFFVNHLGFSQMVGIFTDYDGSFMFNETRPEESSVQVVISPAGIQTSSKALNKELQGSNWFNAKQFPEMKFISTSIKLTGEKTADITGDFTLLGVTKPVTLKVRFNKTGYHPLTNDYIAGFYAEGVIKRSDFGMDYLTSMGVGDDVYLQIQAEGINQDRKRPAIVHQH